MRRSLINVIHWLVLPFGLVESFRSALLSSKYRSNYRYSYFTHFNSEIIPRKSNILASFYNSERGDLDDLDEMILNNNPRLNKDLNELQNWIIKNEGHIENIKVNELPYTNNDLPQGWGLQALGNITKGETLVRIPRKLCISPDIKPTEMDDGVWNVLQEMENVIKEQTPEELCEDGKVNLALAVLSERTKTESFYYPYVANLPAAFRGFPVFFNVTELNALEDHSVMNAVKERCSFLLRFTSESLRHLTNLPNDPFHGFVIDPNVLGWSVAAACSRAIQTEPGKKEMIPFIDIANHDFQPNAQVRISESGDVELFAIKDIASGEAVTMSYGTHTNNELLLNYGFTCWPNPYDRIGIDFNQRMLQASRILLNIQNEPFGAFEGDQDEIAPWQLQNLLKLNLEGFNANLQMEFGGPSIIDGRLLAALRILFAESYAELGHASLSKLQTWSGNNCRRIERRAISTAIGICFILLRAFQTTIQMDELKYSGKYLEVDIDGKGDKTQVRFFRKECSDSTEIPSVPDWMYGGKEPKGVLPEPQSADDPSSLTWEMKEAIKYRILKKQLLCETIARLYGKLEVIGAVGGEQDLIESGGEYYYLDDED